MTTTKKQKGNSKRTQCKNAAGPFFRPHISEGPRRASGDARAGVLHILPAGKSESITVIMKGNKKQIRKG